MSDTDNEKPVNQQLAEDRTDLAEDRTLLANERTYAGWCRTAFAAIALGLGFNALFNKVEPAWVAKGIATLFIALGIFIIRKAQKRSLEVVRNNTEHEVNITQPETFRVIAWSIILGAIMLIVSIWWLT